MRLRIMHRTVYRYSAPVSLGKHILRVLPRRDAPQRLLSHALHVEPQPCRRIDFVDAWGNSATGLAFEGETEVFRVDVDLEVETSPASRSREGFGDALRLPVDYGSEAAALQPYRVLPAVEQTLEAFTRPLVADCDGRIGPLLVALNREVHAFYRHDVRLAGAARTPAETLRRREGVCRDLAVLFAAACRQLGLAARFVSGYQERPAGGEATHRYLHAWSEVYLPAMGWCGFDQTHASPVADAHVIVASAAEPAEAAPIEGSIGFRGEAPETQLAAELRIERVEGA